MKTPHSRTFDCEFAGQEVTLTWNEIVTHKNLTETFPPRLGMRGCTGTGCGDCPVSGPREQRDFSACPHLPQYR